MSSEETDKDVMVRGGPPLEPGFEDRFATLVKAIGSQREAAALLGVAPETVGRWRSRQQKIPFEQAAVLAEAAGSSLDWLAYGIKVDRSTADTALDENYLADVIASLECVIVSEGASLSPEKKARCIILLYQYFSVEQDLDAAFTGMLQIPSG